MEIAQGGWVGQAVDLSRIEEALRQTWREEAARAVNAGEALTTRTNVLNLVVYTRGQNEATRVAKAIERLGGHHPSRTIILIAEPEADDAAIDSWVTTNVLTLPGNDRRLLFEQVTIAARGEAARHLPTVVDPLLIADLPGFLWWLGEPPFHSSSFSRMIEIVDRLIVDSASFTEQPRAMHELAELSVIPYGVTVSDFAWERLQPWRELVAQFFDNPEQAASLGTIARIDVTYEPEGQEQYSGFSEGLLALGWACSRLGWLADQHPTREGPGAFRWQLTTDDRMIEATLRPDHQPDSVVGLRRVTIVANDPYPGTFHVYREADTHLITSVELPGAPNLGQVMRALISDESELLLHSLNRFGRDRAYDGAIVFAAQLAGGITVDRQS